MGAHTECPKARTNASDALLATSKAAKARSTAACAPSASMRLAVPNDVASEGFQTSAATLLAKTANLPPAKLSPSVTTKGTTTATSFKLNTALPTAVDSALVCNTSAPISKLDMALAADAVNADQAHIKSTLHVVIKMLLYI